MTTTKKKIRIMTDSVADIPAALLQKWNIGIIPTYVNFEGGSYADDGVELSRDYFYQRLPEMKEFPTTAAPSHALAEDLLHKGIEGYDHVISIHVASKLSVTANNVRLGAQSLKDRVTVIDSGLVTMGIGMQVLAAAEVAAATGSVEAVVQAVEKVRRHQKLWAIIANLEYLRRSGRVSVIRAFAGSLLQIKPILDVHDGEVEVAQRVRTMGKAVAKLKELTEEQAPLERLVILHINNEDGARELQASLGSVVPPDTITITVGPTLGTHIGPGSLGVITLRKAWRS
ncbi:MAG: DegV family protein [Anaerolineae bacterium]|jgi:DegV family protein with EDD domain|nr:DegV family protein [Anaerolineae bacterium]